MFAAEKNINRKYGLANIFLCISFQLVYGNLLHIMSLNQKGTVNIIFSKDLLANEVKNHRITAGFSQGFLVFQS